MEKNYLKILLICIIGVLVVMLASIFNLDKILNNGEEQIQSSNNTTISESVIVPDNSYLFFGRYVSGDVTSKELYESIYNYGNGKFNSKLIKIEFINDSIIQTQNYTISKLKYTYENNQELNISIKVYLKKNKNKASIEFYE